MSTLKEPGMHGTGGKPRIALTLGDPAGIGPEIVAAAVRDPRVRAAADLLLIGPGYLRDETTAGTNALYIAIDELAATDAYTADHSQATLSNRRAGHGLLATTADLSQPSRHAAADYARSIGLTGPLDRVPFGHASIQGGRAALAALRLGHELAFAGEVDALVTAPVCKEDLHLAGEKVEGQTQLLAAWAGAEDCQMMAIAGNMRVLIATRHMALTAAIASLTPDLIEARLQLLHTALIELGFPKPHIALAGLNPHASEGGLFGDEEARVLQPALDRVRAAGLHVTGPEPPDTLFARAAEGRFDAVLALYHDQGFIPVKLAAPDSALTLLLGMPYLRISPAHGTAFDIAGLGTANPENQIGALLAAASFAQARAKG